MAYQHSVFAIDLKAFRDVWGRENPALGDDIRDDQAEAIANNYDQFEEDIVEHGAPVVARSRSGSSNSSNHASSPPPTCSPSWRAISWSA